MEGIKKKISNSFKRDKVGDTVTDGPVAMDLAGNTSTQLRDSRKTGRLREIGIMPPDKLLEEKVLQTRFEYLSSNLPPDDVAMEMNSRGLLTVKEHDEYLSMKRAHTSDSTKSEYLLQCLGRRKAGFLTRFCEILRAIEQASYLADDIEETYKMARIQIRGSNSRLDRLSNLSLSDPDLHTKGVYGAQECTRCKILERRFKALEKKHTKLKEQQELFQTIILPFKPLAEVAQDQLKRALTEGNKLKELLPSMQEAVTQTTGQISAVQVSLQKINDMLTEGTAMQKEPEGVVGRTAKSAAGESLASEKASLLQTNDFERQAYRQQDGNGFKKATQGSQPYQLCTEGHADDIQASKPTSTGHVMQRTRSESGVVLRRQTMQRMRAVGSADSKPQQLLIDSGDPQLHLILKRRRECIEDTFNSDNAN